MSYAAAQRQAEMGVRIALGATCINVVSILVGSGARLAAIGLSRGLAIALVAGRLIESMPYGIRPQDPLASSGAVLLREESLLRILSLDDVSTDPLGRIVTIRSSAGVGTRTSLRGGALVPREHSPWNAADLLVDSLSETNIRRVRTVPSSL